MDIVQIHFLGIEPNQKDTAIIKKVLEQCYQQENLQNKKIYVNVILTNPENIRMFNQEYRKIDEATDVLSFPMFHKAELEVLNNPIPEVLGDIVISIEKVQEQAEEYEHSFERELSYMVVHGFYHLLGYDHIEEEDKKVMRQKEEMVLEKLDR